MSDLPAWYEQEKEVFGLDNRELATKLINEGAIALMYLRALDYSENVDVRPMAKTELEVLQALFDRATREVLGGEK